MTTEELENLMKAHKCYIELCQTEEEFNCILLDPESDFTHESGVIGNGSGPSIVEAVYEALKSKCGNSMYSQKELQGKVEWIVSSPEAREIVDP